MMVTEFGILPLDCMEVPKPSHMDIPHLEQTINDHINDPHILSFSFLEADIAPAGIFTNNLLIED